MATLAAPHWEAVTTEARSALAVLGQLPTRWDQVKAFFMTEARRLGWDWFGSAARRSQDA